MMEEELNVQDLLVKTTCVGALGIAGAEAFRYGFQRFIQRKLLSGSKFSSQINDFVHSAVSAYILILTGYEKAILLLNGMRGAFFILTFIMCILFSTIFASAAPSPFFPLQKYWKRLLQAGQTPQRGKKNVTFLLRARSVSRMFILYMKLAWPFLLGQCFGLFASVRWMKIYWDGWLTSHHMTYLPFLDECIECLNTNTMMAFFIETLITIAFLYSFDYIDNIKLPQDGANKLLDSYAGRSGLKSAIIILSMYLFIDVTGSFANPFQALAMQRHCFTDLSISASLVIVYLVGPFVGTISYLLLEKGGPAQKAKRSV